MLRYPESLDIVWFSSSCVLRICLRITALNLNHLALSIIGSVKDAYKYQLLFAKEHVVTCLLLNIFLSDPHIIFGPVFGGQVTHNSMTWVYFTGDNSRSIAWVFRASPIDCRYCLIISAAVVPSPAAETACLVLPDLTSPAA